MKQIKKRKKEKKFESLKFYSVSRVSGVDDNKYV